MEGELRKHLGSNNPPPTTEISESSRAAEIDFGNQIGPSLRSGGAEAVQYGPISKTPTLLAMLEVLRRPWENSKFKTGK